MTYRDDREADRARITALETELASAKAEIARLEGRRETALVLASGGALQRAGSDTSGKLPWYGAPLRLELTRTFDGAFPTEDFETLVETIRTISRDAGRTELLRSSMTWSASSGGQSTGPFMTITVGVKDGKTTLTATDRLGNLAGAIYGGFGGGLGGGGIILPLLPVMLGAPFLVPVTVVGWLGGVFLGSRSLYRRAARKRAEQMQQVFDALSAEITAVLAAR